MEWYQRLNEGILTSADEKLDTPDGLWHQCPECKATIHIRTLKEHSFVCDNCQYHFKLDSQQYFELIFTEGKFEELFTGITPADPLHFKDTKPYQSRVEDTLKKSGLEEACRVAVGKIQDEQLVIACMDFRFIGGSMGAVMGEKISRAIDYSLAHKLPLMIISKSGGARMMEGALSLMQMAKVSAKLTLLHNAGIPYISFLTDPTTGGVTASFAMLGDLNIAEPGALIGFAGPRVIRETIGRDLPEGFQTAEFVLEHGFLDFIVHRKQLQDKLHMVLRHLKK